MILGLLSVSIIARITPRFFLWGEDVVPWYCTQARLVRLSPTVYFYGLYIPCLLIWAIRATEVVPPGTTRLDCKGSTWSESEQYRVGTLLGHIYADGKQRAALDPEIHPSVLLPS
jgi:hypothetical protein